MVIVCSVFIKFILYSVVRMYIYSYMRYIKTKSKGEAILDIHHKYHPICMMDTVSTKS